MIVGKAASQIGAPGRLLQVLETVVLVSVLAFVAFIAWNVRQLSMSNDWSAIERIVGPIVGFALLAIATAGAAVIVGRSERRHELAVVGAGASGAAVTPHAPVVVPTRPWRGSALAGLAIVALGFSILASARLGHLRTGTEFTLREKQNVAQCDAWNCTPSEYNRLSKACSAATDTSDKAYVAKQAADYGDNCYVRVAQCAARLLAPLSASTEDQVAIDLVVRCDDAPPQRMPRITAVYYGESVTKCDPEDKTHGNVTQGWTGYRHPTGEMPCYKRYDTEQPSGALPVHRSFALARTKVQNERVWRWFVSFKNGGTARSGDHPIDVQLTFLDDAVTIPLKSIAVSTPTTLGSLQEYTTALGGLLGALIGLFGTIGSLLKGLRGHSSTVVAALGGTFGANAPDAAAAPADATATAAAEPPPAAPPP